MADEKQKPNIFQQMLNVGSAMLDAQLQKARNSLTQQPEPGEFNFGKAITRDRTYYLGSQGFQEKPGALTYEYQKQMAIKSSIVSAIIKTRQNQASSHTEYVPEGNKVGFKIKLKKESEKLEEIMEELFGPQESSEEESSQGSNDIKDKLSESASEIKKAAVDMETMNGLANQDPKKLNPESISEADRTREAKKELEKRTKKKKDSIAEFLVHCGELNGRPFESKKWNLNAYLRALIWDTYTYDQIATELVPKEAEKMEGRLNIHHFQPVDGSTVRYASQELAKYRDADLTVNQDILYPEEELKALEERDALELDAGRLEKNEYKYVQLIRGRIIRAFTEDELKVSMRNPVTDIHTNGYSISELELLVALVTSHLQTEFYNRSYFQQGFSAKGILHVKANLNRSKLEELRRNWNHMVKGNRNSFQTPIMAGMDEVQWIPLTQNHNEMEFSLWLNYLIRMICAIYQIDPSEIGYGMREEGGGAGMSGDNTREKMKQSKDKGFVPLMKFLQSYLNTNIVDNLDPDYMLEWTGLEEESKEVRVMRQEKEVKFKKSVNEIRAEDGLPPIKGADDLILDPNYMTWYSQYSDEGRKMTQEKQSQQMDMMDKQSEQMGQGQDSQDPSHEQQWQADEAKAENDHSRNIESKVLDAQLAPKPKPLAKSKTVKVEFYKLED